MQLLKNIWPGYFVFGLFLSLTSITQAQQATRLLYLGASANAYRGDLSDDVIRAKPGLVAGIRFNGEKKLNGNIALGIGSVLADNPDYSPNEKPENIRVNRYARTSFFNLNLDLQYKVINTESWQLYLSQGFGFFRFKPFNQDDEALQSANSSRLPDESYGNLTVMLPTQVGAIYLLPNQWGIGIQAGLLNPLTDYLDNIKELGNRSGNDNVMQTRLLLYVPLNTTAAQ
jgi:hypothetical protein